MSSAITLSDILGYTSIGCWLGAQFPQVLENARRQSVEGLALPFLINWLLGDFTNLVGCILTRQLPFQTWLATYFCFVDCALLGQFYYYRSISPPNIEPFAPPFLQNRSRTVSNADQHRNTAHYRAISAAAAHVAASAAIAAHKDEHVRHVKRSPETRRSTTEAAERDEDEDEVSEEALARLTESFHSERTHSKKVSWNQERFSGRGSSLGRYRQATISPVLHMTPQSDQPDPIATRGRPLERPPTQEGGHEEDSRATSTTAPRRNSRASRKRASMVFLGAWTLFGIGTLAGGQHGFMPATQFAGQVGRVLTQSDIGGLNTTEQLPVATLEPPRFYVSSYHPRHIHDAVSAAANESSEQPSTEFIIGRISAWICTTLYLTSRLPQIWKNFVRKSVEGLSVLLFIFAFLGNSFYVASILTSPHMSAPPHQASAFIRESIPYLLGSGGTLMFDVTIVVQSILYRRRPQPQGRRLSRTVNEEEQGLLSADATGAQDYGSPSRRRTGSSVDPE